MNYYFTDDSLNTLINIIKEKQTEEQVLNLIQNSILTEEQIRAIVQEEINKQEKEEDNKEAIELIEGNWYYYCDSKWICAKNENGYSILQSDGITSSAWPGYLSTNAKGKVDISSYYTILEQQYELLKDGEYIPKGKTKGNGLYLPSIKDCNVSASGDTGTGYYIEGLKQAASRYSLLNAKACGAWLRDESTSGYAWFAFTDGRCLNYGIQSQTYSLAPVFELDLTKVQLNGDVINLK